MHNSRFLNGAPTRSYDRAHLHDYIIGCSSDRALFYVKGVFADPSGDDRMEIRISRLPLSAHQMGRSMVKWEKLTARYHCGDGESTPIVPMRR